MNGKRTAFAVVLATAHVATALGGEPSETEIACGPRALALAARLVSKEVTDGELRAAFDGQLTGPHSFKHLQNAAKSLGLTTRRVRLDPAAPQLELFPLIAVIDQPDGRREADHFVVICRYLRPLWPFHANLGPSPRPTLRPASLDRAAVGRVGIVRG